jgi:putative oxidoreductase
MSYAEPRPLIPALTPLYARLEPLSWLIVRCAAGLIMAVHGWGKLSGGVAAYTPTFEKLGYHPAAAIVLLLTFVEFVGGLAVAAGLFTRFFAAACAIELAEITFDVYWHAGFSWTKGGYEYALMWGLVFFAIALRGGGPLSMDRWIGREL